MGRWLPGVALLRKSNRCLYREACDRPGEGRRLGPTPLQARLNQANRVDELFVEGCLIEESLESPPYAHRSIVRQLDTGRILRMSVFAKEVALDADGYRAVAKQVLAISETDVVHPTKIFVSSEGLAVLRPYITGESLSQLINRAGPIPADTAIKITILLLNLLSKLDSKRITWIHPSQLILTSKDRMVLVDLDESEAMFFKRQIRLKSTNNVLLTGKDRKFIAPEALRATGYDPQRALLYSVGQILSHLLWPNGLSHERQSLDRTRVAESVRHVIEQMSAPEPTERPSTYDQAIRKLQLINQASVASSITYPVQPHSLDLSDRPVVRTLSLSKSMLLLTALVFILVSVGYASRSLSQSGGLVSEDIQQDDTPTIVQSNESFQIP